MYSIKIDIDDNILDKVMFFLKSIPKKNMEVKKIDSSEEKKDQKLGDFFAQSPLNQEVFISREQETYEQRVKF